jgi:sugar phosphate isomerase/epimerase
MQRRTVLKHAALLAGGVLLPGRAVASESASDADRPYGVQLFTIPKMVEGNLPGTLALLRQIGYREVEFFGPYPFSAEATKQSWETVRGMVGLNDNAFYGYTAGEVAGMLGDNDLTVPSVHADLLSLREDAAGFARGMAPLQARYVVVPSLEQPLRSSLDDYKRLADEFNRIGERLSAEGMQFGYHNHGYEHLTMDGRVPLDYLLEHTDPERVVFELDIFWMTAAGADPIDYLERYPGRFRMIHLKDARQPFRFSGDGQTPDQWFAGFPLMADPGEGVLDVAKIVAAAEASGVHHYYLERDLAPEPEATLRNSYGKLVEM